MRRTVVYFFFLMRTIRLLVTTSWINCFLFTSNATRYVMSLKTYWMARWAVIWYATVYAMRICVLQDLAIFSINTERVLKWKFHFDAIKEDEQQFSCCQALNTHKCCVSNGSFFGGGGQGLVMMFCGPPRWRVDSQPPHQCATLLWGTLMFFVLIACVFWFIFRKV